MLIGKSVATMHFPLWDPFDYCGMSLAALAAPSVFCVQHLVFAFLPYNAGVALILIFSELLCAWGAYLLIRSIGWGRLPALLAGATVGFSGYMFSFVNNFSLIETASFIPLCLFCSRRIAIAAERSAVKWCLLLALCIALMILGGRPEICGAGLVLVCLFVWVQHFGLGTRVALRQRVVLQVKGIAMGVLLAMPEIMPSLEWLPWSRRAGGLTPREILQFSASWYHMIGLFAGQPLGDLQINSHGLRALIEPKNFPPYFQTAFVGPIAVCLAAMGLRPRGALVYWGVIVVFVGSAALSLGHNVPFMSELVSALPFLSAVRFPSKLMFFVTMCLAFFAARGLNNYAERKASLIPYAVAAAIALLGGGVLVVWPHVLLPFVAGSNTLKQTAQVSIGVAIILWDLLALGGLAILVGGARSDRRVQAAAVTTATAILAVFVNAWSCCRHYAPGSFFDQPSLAAKKLEQLEPDATARSRTMMLAMENLSVPPLATPEDPFSHAVRIYGYQRDLLKPFANVDFGVRGPWGWDGPTSGEYINLMLNLYLKSSQSMSPSTPGAVASDEPLYRLLQTTATRFVITQAYRFVSAGGNRMTGAVWASPVPPLSPQFFNLKVQSPAANMRIYELSNWMPRAYLSYSWSLIERDKVIDMIAEAPAGGFDPHKVTLLEEASSEAPASVQSPQPAEAVIVEERQPEDIRVHASAKAPSLLVLCDQFYPGWTAEVDGVRAPVLRANGFMKAVALSQGDHIVRFEFQPKSLFTGVILFALAVLWAALLVWQDARKRQLTKESSEN